MKTLTCGCCDVGCVCANHCDIPNGLVPRKCNTHTFEGIVNRVFKGMIFGADDATIRTQLASESVGSTFIELAITKARGTYNRLQERGMLAK